MSAYNFAVNLVQRFLGFWRNLLVHVVLEYQGQVFADDGQLLASETVRGVLAGARHFDEPLQPETEIPCKNGYYSFRARDNFRRAPRLSFAATTYAESCLDNRPFGAPSLPPPRLWLSLRPVVRPPIAFPQAFRTGDEQLEAADHLAPT